MGESSRPRWESMFAAVGGTAKTTSSLPSANSSRVRWMVSGDSENMETVSPAGKAMAVTR